MARGLPLAQSGSLLDWKLRTIRFVILRSFILCKFFSTFTLFLLNKNALVFDILVINAFVLLLLSFLNETAKKMV